MRQSGMEVSPELRHLAQLPKSTVTEHKRMWAYGNHYSAQDPLVGNTYLTYDSGVACIASAVCVASTSDTRPIEADLKYVGVLRKILQVDYVYRKINVMVCDWIKPNVAGNATMKQDSHGFWVIKKGAFQGPRAEPYILPAHASQVRRQSRLRPVCILCYFWHLNYRYVYTCKSNSETTICSVCISNTGVLRPRL